MDPQVGVYESQWSPRGVGEVGGSSGRATCSTFVTGPLRLARHQRPSDRIAIFSVRPEAGNMSDSLYEKTEVTRALKEERDHLGLPTLLNRGICQGTCAKGCHWAAEGSGPTFPSGPYFYTLDEMRLFSPISSSILFSTPPSELGASLFCHRSRFYQGLPFL